MKIKSQGDALELQRIINKELLNTGFYVVLQLLDKDTIDLTLFWFGNVHYHTQEHQDEDTNTIKEIKKCVRCSVVNYLTQTINRVIDKL